MDQEYTMQQGGRDHDDVMRELGGINARLDGIDAKIYALTKSIEGNGQPGLRQGFDELKGSHGLMAGRLAITEGDIKAMKQVAGARFGNTTTTITIIISALALLVAIVAIFHHG